MSAPESGPARRCHVATFGCRVNTADSQSILERLREHRFEAAEGHADADLVVINSCTVTHRSDADIRKMVNRVHRENPDAKVIVAGCYAQRDPEALVQLRGLSAVVGHTHGPEIAEVAARVFEAPADTLPLVVHSELDAVAPEDLPPVEPVAVMHDDRTRPFVKIQDGCDAHCTYCIIPAVRGGARSAPVTGVLRSVQKLIDQGFYEVVLAGVHLGTYLHEGQGLAELVRAVLALPDLGRLRLSCIEPMAFPMELADIARDEPRLAPHFHLPLQAGHDGVLKRMGRPYRAEDFRQIIEGIRARVPHACIGSDVIVGFPGESEDAFQESKLFCAEVGLDYLHVFSYSARDGAPSTRLPDPQTSQTIKRRSAELRAVGDRLWRRFLDAQVGRELSALTLSPAKREPERYEALSDSYCPIYVPAGELASGMPVQVEILAREGARLRGRVTRVGA